MAGATSSSEVSMVPIEILSPLMFDLQRMELGIREESGLSGLFAQALSLTLGHLRERKMRGVGPEREEDSLFLRRVYRFWLWWR